MSKKMDIPLNKARKESQEVNQSNTESVCNAMKEKTSRIIKKMESQIPIQLQYYSDLYKAYLHSYDDFFNSCNTSEKQVLEKLGIPKSTLKAFDEYSEVFTEIYSTQIEAYTNFLKEYVQMRISVIDLFDRNTHVMMDSYSKMLFHYNKSLKTGLKKEENLNE